MKDYELKHIMRIHEEAISLEDVIPKEIKLATTSRQALRTIFATQEFSGVALTREQWDAINTYIEAADESMLYEKVKRGEGCDFGGFLIEISIKPTLSTHCTWRLAIGQRNDATSNTEQVARYE